MTGRQRLLCVADAVLYLACPEDKRLVYDMMHEDGDIRDILFCGGNEASPWAAFEASEAPWFTGAAGRNAYCLIERGGEWIGWVSHSYNDAAVENMEMDIAFRSLAHAGCGLGPAVLTALTDYLNAEYDIITFIIRPGRHNRRAIRAYEKSGFMIAGAFDPALYYTQKDAALWGDGDYGAAGTVNMIKTY